MPNPSSSPDAFQQNAVMRAAVLRSSVDMLQNVYSATVAPTSTPTLNIPPRNVGLIKRFLISVDFTINNTGTTTISLTDFGLANLFSQISFVDLNNYTRIQTIGAHLSLIASAKRRRPFGATYNANTNATNNRSQVLNVPPASWPVIVAPATIANATSGTCRVIYEVPLAYSDKDLRGAVYANVINATQNLQLVFNSQPVVDTSVADSTYAIYSGAAGSAGSITSATVNVYQNYLDQLPVANGRVILPTLDLSTIYELKNTNFTAITANQDFPISYSNFRSFLSTFAIFNQTGTNSGRNYGTDVNYWALQAANFTMLKKVDPKMAAQLSRDQLTIDLPAGTYYFPTREMPIETTQYGNFNLVLNATAGVTATGFCQVMWEDLALQNTLVSAGSLAAS